MNKGFQSDEFLRAVADSVGAALAAPKCDPQESAVLIDAAMVAIRKLANEARRADEASSVAQWLRAYRSLAAGCKTRAEFLAKFADLTDSPWVTPSPDFESLCVDEASRCALLAANPGIGRNARIDALHWCGVATGALAMLSSPDLLRQRFQKAHARQAANVRHKDDRADRVHVWKWLAEHRHQYRTDAERVDAIMGSKQVSKARTTIQRWVTEWNREQREKRDGS